MNDELKTYLEGMESRLSTRSKQDLAVAEERIISKLSVEIGDVASSVSALATHVDERFDKLETEMRILSRDSQSHEKRIGYLEDKVLRTA